MNALDNYGLSVVQHRKRTVKRLGRMKEDVFSEKEETEIGIGYLVCSCKSTLCLNIYLEQIDK